MDQITSPVLNGTPRIRWPEREGGRPRPRVGPLAFESPRYELVGSGPAMREVKRVIAKIAPAAASVLVLGASGTGKELVARALHHNSPRRARPLVKVLCAGLQENLLESELFGHEKGAFTGAHQAKQGLAEVADGGTLFIDEVAEMAPALQARLLRFLEDGSYRRVGGTQDRHADVRIVAATNNPLDDVRRDGRFRQDLYHRLNVITVALPPLRERREDLPELIDHFLTTRGPARPPFRVTPAARAALGRYDWPGNVRELANVLERAQVLADDDTITLDDLPAAVAAAAGPAPPAADDDRYSLAAAEGRLLHEVLRLALGNKLAAARLMGVSPRTLYRMIERYGVTDPLP